MRGWRVRHGRTPIGRVEQLETRILLTLSALYPTITLDPSTRLATSDVLGEWNGSTQDGWTVNNAASTTVANGSITVTSQNGTANPTQLDLTNIAGGPDLDFGYFDYLQIRLQLPANYNKDLMFEFGTTTHPGFSTDREFIVQAANLAKDGAAHTYRLDLGLVVWWRDTLHDLRVQPLGTTGANETASIDYVEVGDLPGDVLQLNTDLNYAPGVTSATVQHLESKHFAIWWDPAVDPGGRGFDPAVEGLHALRMLEESYKVYCKVLGYDEPFQTTTHTGPRVKLNVITWYSGYWEGVSDGYAHLNVDTSGLQDEGVGNPIPHEFGHCIQSNQLGALAGGHWESDANYLRDQRNEWFAPLFATGTQSSISLNVMTWSNFEEDDHRIIYEDYRIFDALQEYATSLGLPADEVAQLWRTGTSNLTAWAKLASLLPAGMNIKDVAGTLLRYWPMLDFPSQKAFMQAQMWGTAAQKTEYMWRTGSPLVPDPDQAGWYRVPMERAPEKYAYMYHVLTPNSGATSMTVTLRGLGLSSAVSTDADWRWSLAFTDGNGNVLRYSDVFAPGTQTVALNPGETQVLLIVVATPGNPAEELNNFYNTEPTDKNSNRVRYPYEVQITGATPTITPLNLTAPVYKPASTNPDGSPRGLIANTATVAATAYVGINARVLGKAQVLGNAVVTDYAVVTDRAIVRGNAVVSGYALVRNNAIVQDNALVTDHAIIEVSAQVQGNAVVEQYARMGDTAIIKDQAIARGDSYLWGTAVVSGYAIADYDYSMNYAVSDGNQFNHIPFDSYFDTYYAATQTKPRGLIASYDVTETSGEELWDTFGSLEAWLRGTPSLPTDSFFNNSQVLSLNGTSQYALLDRSLGNLTSGTYDMWVNPTSATADQTLLYFGSSANTFLKLTARDANGFAHLTISVNGVVQQLVATIATPLNTWTNLAVTFGNGTATFYVNGGAAGTGAITFRPVDVLGPDTDLASEAYYLGRDPSGNYFSGKLEDVRFYNVALTNAEVTNEMSRSGAKLAELYAIAAMNFNGTTTTAESGIHDGATRTLSAWVNPRSNAAAYEAILDAYDERGSGNNRGTGFGVAGGVIEVRLNGVGLWNTGVPVTLNAWQQITVTISGGTARVYVNGVQKATRTYTTGVTAAKNYHLGFYQTDDNSPPTQTGFFNGQLYDVRVYESVVVPTGKFDQPPLAAGDTASVPAGVPSIINVLANDTDPNPIVTLAVSAVTQGAHGTVAISNGGANVTYTPAAGYVGSDSFTYTASDGFGGTSTATVNVASVITLSSIVVSPNSTSLTNGGTQQFSATAYDSAGNPLIPQPTFSWSIVSGSGTITPSGGMNPTATFTAGQNTESVVVQAITGTLSATATVNVTSSAAPTITTAPSANPAPITGTTTNLSVLATDPAGESTLTYTWSTLAAPAAVSFSANGTNAAKNLVATFSKAGAYTFQVKIANPSGNYTLSNFSVQVNQTLSGISVTPASNPVAANTSDQFTAGNLDQFGNTMAGMPAVTWSITSGGGSINSSGLLSAPRTAGPVTVRATTAGGLRATSTVTVNYEEVAWYQADTSGTTLVDSSGHNQTATLTAPDNFVTGVSGTALNLTGGYAKLPNGIVSSLNDFTIAAWVKINTLSTWSRIFDFGTGTTSYMFLTPQANGAGGPLRFAITTNGNGAEQQLNGPVLSAGVWYHIAITLVGNTATMYVNGAVVASTTGLTVHPAALGNTTLNYIGKSQFNDPALMGSIDDFRIFSRGLSAAEVQRLAKPAIVTPAAAASNPIVTASTTLSVLGSDVTAGEGALTYTWSTTGTAPGAVIFSLNGTNAAKNTVATFTQPGTYNFQVTIDNPALGATFATISSVSVTVNRTLTSITVTPSSASLFAGQTQQFSAIGFDQFGATLAVQPAFVWSIDSGSIGGISTTGLYSAPTSAIGSSTVRATSGLASGTANVNVAWLQGDLNGDGKLTSADLSTLMMALSDLTAYQTLRGISNSDLLAIADVDHDNKITNADLPALIGLLTNAAAGGGSRAASAEAPQSAAVLPTSTIGNNQIGLASTSMMGPPIGIGVKPEAIQSSQPVFAVASGTLVWNPPKQYNKAEMSSLPTLDNRPSVATSLKIDLKSKTAADFYFENLMEDGDKLV